MRHTGTNSPERVAKRVKKINDLKDAERITRLYPAARERNIKGTVALPTVPVVRPDDDEIEATERAGFTLAPQFVGQSPGYVMYLKAKSGKLMKRFHRTMERLNCSILSGHPDVPDMPLPDSAGDAFLVVGGIDQLDQLRTHECVVRSHECYAVRIPIGAAGAGEEKMRKPTQIPSFDRDGKRCVYTPVAKFGERTTYATTNGVLDTERQNRKLARGE